MWVTYTQAPIFLEVLWSYSVLFTWYVKYVFGNIHTCSEM